MKGMGTRFSGGKNTGKKLVFDPSKTQSRMGNKRPWASVPDRYQKVSKNPSGASNRPNEG